mgnify:FL=1
MCVHHWILDSRDRGACNKCGKKKDFSPPPIRLTYAEKCDLRKETDGYYLQGSLSNKLN